VEAAAIEPRFDSSFRARGAFSIARSAQAPPAATVRTAAATSSPDAPAQPIRHTPNAVAWSTTVRWPAADLSGTFVRSVPCGDRDETVMPKGGIGMPP
jgi:hypothetical protein